MRIDAKLCLKSRLILPLCSALAMSVQTSGQQLITFDAPGSSTGVLQGTAVWGINAEGAITGDVTDSSGATHGYVRKSSWRLR